MKDLISKICKKGKKACGSVVQNALATKRAALSISALTICILSMAQCKGAAGFQKAATEISSYQDPVQKLLYAIAGVIALVGAFNIYFKMQNGDQDHIQDTLFSKDYKSHLNLWESEANFSSMLLLLLD